MRCLAGITNRDTVSEMDAHTHELTHGVAGFRYQNALSKARNTSGGHIPGSCTTDHSPLQVSKDLSEVSLPPFMVLFSKCPLIFFYFIKGPVWDWYQGYPKAIPMNYCHNSKRTCWTMPFDVVRLQANDDCASCPDHMLSSCCTFRYVDALATKIDMQARPELRTMSPLLQYIAGLLHIEEVPANQTYYCIGPEDGELHQPGGHTVDDSDRSRVTSSYVSRFTFEELVAANGGPRRPPVRTVRDLRHGAVYVGQRTPSDAELAFYTMLWRHQEIERQPWGRVPRAGRRFNREDVLITWLYNTNGLSALHSRFHGIPCGGGLQVPSCTNDESVCDESPCHPLATCIPLDGRPLCVCTDGTFGDGSVCAFSNETRSYPLPLAHDLYNESPSRRASCFGTNWPEYITPDMLPAYPGGIAPYSAIPCTADNGPNTTEQCTDWSLVSPPPTPSAFPTPAPTPTKTPNFQYLVKRCRVRIFHEAKCSCRQPKQLCIRRTINQKCMKDYAAANKPERFRQAFRSQVNQAVQLACNRLDQLVRDCVYVIFNVRKCTCPTTRRRRNCIDNAIRTGCRRHRLDTQAEKKKLAIKVYEAVSRQCKGEIQSKTVSRRKPGRKRKKNGGDKATVAS